MLPSCVCVCVCRLLCAQWHFGRSLARGRHRPVHLYPTWRLKAGSRRPSRAERRLTLATICWLLRTPGLHVGIIKLICRTCPQHPGSPPAQRALFTTVQDPTHTHLAQAPPAAVQLDSSHERLLAASCHDLVSLGPICAWELITSCCGSRCWLTTAAAPASPASICRCSCTYQATAPRLLSQGSDADGAGQHGGCNSTGVGAQGDRIQGHTQGPKDSCMMAVLMPWVVSVCARVLCSECLLTVPPPPCCGQHTKWAAGATAAVSERRPARYPGL